MQSVYFIFYNFLGRFGQGVYRGSPHFPSSFSWLGPADKMASGHGYNTATQPWHNFAKNYNGQQGVHAYPGSYGYPPTPPEDTAHSSAAAAAAAAQHQQQQAAAAAVAGQHQDHPMSESPMPQQIQQQQSNQQSHSQHQSESTVGARMTPDRITASPAGPNLPVDGIKADPSVATYPSAIFGHSFPSKSSLSSLSPPHNSSHPAGYPTAYSSHGSMDFSAATSYSGFYPTTSMFGKPFPVISSSATSPSGDKSKNVKRNSAG